MVRDGTREQADAAAVAMVAARVGAFMVICSHRFRRGGRPSLVASVPRPRGPRQ
jgi:hypothetical protein